MISFATFSAIVTIYFLIILITAEVAEKKFPFVRKITNSSFIYVLSLTVYCSTWSYYGSVGLASTSGLLFLSIYIGPILGAFFWQALIGNLLKIRDRYRITTLADLLVVRYGKSANLGALVATFVFIAFIPYVALQIKAIVTTTSIITSHNEVSEASNFIFELLFMSAITLFTIFFGLRRLDATERHTGMVFTIALEGIIKLITFVIPALAVVCYVNIGADNFWAHLESAPKIPHLGLGGASEFIDFIFYTVIAACAFLFLPRQFHMGIIENNSSDHVNKAQWQVPLYIFLFTLLVIPLAVSGNFAGQRADEYMLLTIPLHLMKSNLLAMLVYIGGISAGIGMISICTMAISTMVSNHMFLKLIHDLNWFDKLHGRILYVRWLIAIFIIFISYFYQKIMGSSIALVSMGMISFVAIFQIVPAILLGLYWKRANLCGAFIGLISGISIWFYTLFLPAFAKNSFLLSPGFVENGPFGISWLRPEALFYLEGLSSISHASLWSTFFNIGGIVLGAYLFKHTESAEEKLLRKDFFQIELPTARQVQTVTNQDNHINITYKLELVKYIFDNYLGKNEAERKLQDIIKRLSPNASKMIPFAKLVEFKNIVEQELAGAIGSSAAHNAIIKSGIISKEEEGQLANSYAAILANLQISPEELQSKVDFYIEREQIFLKQAEELTRLLAKRDLENSEKNREIFLANEQLNQKNSELQTSLAEIRELQQKIIYSNRMSSLGAMASGISHEINTPLNTITLGTELLVDHLNTPTPNIELVQGQLKRITETAQRIGSIVKGLKSFASEDTNSPMENVALQAIIDDTLSLCQKKIENQGHQIIVEVSSEIKLYCRPVQVVQVLINLIGNAMDATLNLSEKWIKISATNEVNHVRISIMDSGHGIANSVAQKMMEPFFTTKGVGVGTGLGLSISFGIIQDQGGKLYYNADSPHTEFVIELQKPLP